MTNYSVKHVSFTCPDGVALLAYTGIGRLGTTDVSDWVRGVLRGETRTLNETLTDLREQATLSLGPYASRYQVPHHFAVAAFVGGQALAVTITNLVGTPDFPTGVVSQKFETGVQIAEQPLWVALGSGKSAVRQKDRNLFERIASRRPRDPRDYINVLSAINRRAAEGKPRTAATNSISRSCSVVYMPPQGKGALARSFWPDDEHPPVDVSTYSHVGFGVDLSEMTLNLRRVTQEAMTLEEYQRRAPGVAERSVQPRGRRKS